MTEICEYLKNWFDRGQPKHFGAFVISDGAITYADGGTLGIRSGQYIRILGSALNDGVWVDGTDGGLSLRDETFDGAVWLLAIPPAVTAISQEIDQWVAKYGAIDGPAMSPFTSESFDGYSYTKAQGGTQYNGNSNGVSASGWVNAFGGRLSRWKKL